MPKVLIQVTVNSRTCMGNQMCVRAAPDIYEMGSAGYPRVVRDVSEDDLARLRGTEEQCPTASIRVDVVEVPAP